MIEPLIDTLTNILGIITIVFFVCVITLIIKHLIMARKKQKLICVKYLNRDYETLTHQLTKKALRKRFLKTKNKKLKNVFVLNFNGNFTASPVHHFKTLVNALLLFATPQDEIVIKLDSFGGSIKGYGLAIKQMERIRAQNIPLTVCIDQKALSCGYYMSVVANKIVCSPYAKIGKIGVLIDALNFHHLLNQFGIEYHEIVSAPLARNLHIYRKNTDDDRAHVQSQAHQAHKHFETHLHHHRPQLDIEQVSNGEDWPGHEAIKLNLVDELKTSERYLHELCEQANVFELHHTQKQNGESLLLKGNLF